MPRRQKVWLSWHDGRRSQSLSYLLGMPMRAYTTRPYGILRHFDGSVWTIQTLSNLLPECIFMQTSVMLQFIAAIYKKLAPWRVLLVADCHNKSLKRRLGGPLTKLFNLIKEWSFKQTDVVIVSNAALVPVAKELSDRVVVLRDPLPKDFEVPRNSTKQAASKADQATHPWTAEEFVLFVCSFDRDEPIDAILNSANSLACQGVSVVITGDPEICAQVKAASMHPRVHMPGFVSDSLYRELVFDAQVVVALTNDDDCLMCAAYEAVAAGKRLVVSATPALQGCFLDLAHYTKNSAHDVTLTILAARKGPPPPKSTVNQFNEAFDRELDTLFRSLPRFEVTSANSVQ